jgi:hypothetical protein
VRLVTGPYIPGAPATGEHVIYYLWSRVDQLPDDQWPTGVIRPHIPHDIGTAGFPDGAGLFWKSAQPMPDFPFGGVMFVGHNTDAAGKHGSRRTYGRSPGEPGNPAMRTWASLYETFRHAGFNPENQMFFTNVYVGLIDGDDQEQVFPGRKDSSFVAWCRAFLDEQIRIMQPRVVVTLGAAARDEFGMRFGQIIPSYSRGGAEFVALSLRHPVARDRRAYEEAAYLRLATTGEVRSGVTPRIGAGADPASGVTRRSGGTSTAHIGPPAPVGNTAGSHPMSSQRIPCNLSWRASRWVEAMTEDPGTRTALAENNLKRKVRVGNGYRVYFELTRAQVDQAIQLLERLETMREASNLPDIGVGQDNVIFTNAIAAFKAVRN